MLKDVMRPFVFVNEKIIVLSPGFIGKLKTVLSVELLTLNVYGL